VSRVHARGLAGPAKFQSLSRIRAAPIQTQSLTTARACPGRGMRARGSRALSSTKELYPGRAREVR